MTAPAFEHDGFCIVPAVLGADACHAVAGRIPAADAGRAGTRCLLSQPWCADLARALKGHADLSPMLVEAPVAVQCTYFEKSAGQNWLVAVHQDLSIPVAERVEDSGLQGWSEKEGELFVQPPTAVLERLVAVRLHLDECSPADGPLRVVPGSHTSGRLGPDAASRRRDLHGEVVCTARRGDVLVMRPLLLHASSKAHGTSRRRVLHFLFGPRHLPLGLAWRHAI
jgi:hypothetical protein